MPKAIDITGQRYGRWLVLKKMGQVNARRMYLCVCDCGTKREVAGYNLRMGASSSCGCLQREIVQQLGKKNARASASTCSWCGRRCPGKYCSKKHEALGERDRDSITCETCGKIIGQHRISRRYCSMSCKNARAKRGRAVVAGIKSITLAQRRLTDE